MLWMALLAGWLDLPSAQRVAEDLFWSARLEVNIKEHNEIRDLKAVYPGVAGGAIGVMGSRFFVEAGFFPEYQGVLTALYQAPLSEQSLFYAGIYRLFLPSMESEGTENDTTASSFLRIPFVLGVVGSPVRGVTFNAGIGTGFFGYDFFENKVRVGGFLGIAVEPVPGVEVFYEGAWPGFKFYGKRNLGVSVGLPAEGLRLRMGWRYVDYTTAQITGDHIFVSLGYSGRIAREKAVREEAPKKPAAPEQVVIAGVVSDAATGQPVAGAIVYKKGARRGVRTDRYGRYVLRFPPGDYTIVVQAYPRYLTQEIPVTLTPDKPRKTLNVQLKVNPVYLQYQAKIREAEQAQSEGDLRAALLAYEEALKLFPKGSEALAGRDAVRLEIQKKIKTLKVQARAAERTRALRKALSLWEQVLALDPEDEEAQAGRARVRRAMASRTRTPTRPQPRPQPSTRPAPTTQSVEELIEAGKKAFLAGDYARAVRLFERALKLDPGNRTAKRYLEKAKTYLKGTGG